MNYRDKPSPQSYLVHHGILGMKWGVRHYQKRDGSLTAKGKERYKENGGYDDKADEAPSSKHKLTDNQKRAIKIGAAVAATTLIAIGTYKLYKSGKLDTFIEKGKGEIDKLLGKQTDNAIEQPSWIDKINPSFKHSTSTDFRMNCGNCALAYEMQSRGIPSEALGNSSGMTKNALLSCFSGVHSKTVLDLDEKINVPVSFTETDTSIRGRKVRDLIAKQISKAYKSTDSARGTLFVPGPLGSHYVSWEKKGTTVAFFNSQDPTRDLLKDCFGTYLPTGDSISSLTAIRLDDLEVNKDVISSFIKEEVLS